jgi:hypothetical protein
MLKRSQRGQRELEQLVIARYVAARDVGDPSLQ